jgi:hypothetical protein
MKGVVGVVFVGLVVIACGCGGGTQEPRSQDEVAAEFVQKVKASEIIFEITATSPAPESMWSLEGPCDPYGENHKALRQLLTADELRAVCCRAFLYEAKKVEYDDAGRALQIETGRPADCLEE